MAFLSSRRSPPRPISCKCGSGGQAERRASILLMQIFVDQAYFYQNLASSKQCQGSCHLYFSIQKALSSLSLVFCAVYPIRIYILVSIWTSGSFLASNLVLTTDLEKEQWSDGLWGSTGYISPKMMSGREFLRGVTLKSRKLQLSSYHILLFSQTCLLILLSWFSILISSNPTCVLVELSNLGLWDTRDKRPPFVLSSL